MSSASNSTSISPHTDALPGAVSIDPVASATFLGVHGPVVIDVKAPAASRHDARENPNYSTMQGENEATTQSGTQRHLRRHVFCAGAVVIAAAWALWPLAGPDGPGVFSADEHGTEPAIKSPEPVPFDLAAFHTPLWMIPPAPPAPPAALPPAPPPAPVRLQLLAIIRESDGYAAMCYDPDADKVWTYREGDSTTKDGVGRKVEKITATSVQFRDASQGGVATTLALKSSPVAGGGK